MGRCAYTNLLIALFAAISTTLIVGCESKVDVSIGPTQIKTLKEKPGYGSLIEDGDTATIEYKVNLPDGTQVLNDDEFRFTINSEKPSVIQGINDSVLGMRVGGSRTVSCPPHLHWGRQGTGDGSIPANTKLIIHIKILDLQKK